MVERSGEKGLVWGSGGEICSRNGLLLHGPTGLTRGRKREREREREARLAGKRKARRARKRARERKGLKKKKQERGEAREKERDDESPTETGQPRAREPAWQREGERTTQRQRRRERERMDVGLVSRSSVTPRPLRSALRLASEVYAVFRRSKLPSFLLLLLLLLLFFFSFSRSRRATRSSNPSTTVEKGTAVLWNLSRCSMAEDLDEVPREVAVVL